jgi:hypothetical protein
MDDELVSIGSLAAWAVVIPLGERQLRECIEALLSVVSWRLARNVLAVMQGVVRIAQAFLQWIWGRIASGVTIVTSIFGVASRLRRDVIRALLDALRGFMSSLRHYGLLEALADLLRGPKQMFGRLIIPFLGTALALYLIWVTHVTLAFMSPTYARVIGLFVGLLGQIGALWRMPPKFKLIVLGLMMVLVAIRYGANISRSIAQLILKSKKLCSPDELVARICAISAADPGAFYAVCSNSEWRECILSNMAGASEAVVKRGLELLRLTSIDPSLKEIVLALLA